MGLHIQVLTVGELNTNCYFIIDESSGKTMIVDPADAPEYISDILLRQKLVPIGIIATHGHFDHILGAFGLQSAFHIPFYIHSADTFLVHRMQESGRHFLKRENVDPKPDISHTLKDGEVIPVGNSIIEILHVPGHTPGSIAVAVPKAHAMLVGDGIFFDGSQGRTDTSYGDKNKLAISIARILKRKDVKTFYAGHGEPIPADRARFMFGV